MSNYLSEGWHFTRSGLSYLVEDGRIVRGVSSDGQRTLYPYVWDKSLRCYNQVRLYARRSSLRRIYWK